MVITFVNYISVTREVRGGLKIISGPMAKYKAEYKNALSSDFLYFNQVFCSAVRIYYEYQYLKIIVHKLNIKYMSLFSELELLEFQIKKVFKDSKFYNAYKDCQVLSLR